MRTELPIPARALSVGRNEMRQADRALCEVMADLTCGCRGRGLCARCRLERAASLVREASDAITAALGHCYEGRRYYAEAAR